MTTNSTWAALRNPAFRKLWIAAVISGTCVAAHDSAATWTMNIFTGSPLLLSLMSTLASLPFFLFTLPAGALADRVNRQKLICTVNVCLAVARSCSPLNHRIHASGLGEQNVVSELIRVRTQPVSSRTSHLPGQTADSRHVGNWRTDQISG